MEKRLKLPTGIQTFEKLRNENCVYVDKTKYLVDLIDEYDKPYTDFFDHQNKANEIREILRNFYSQIKSNDEYIRFIFLTGISKFTKMGVFSTLNNIVDISLHPKYAEICGYTEEEIRKYFPEYLNDTASFLKMTPDELIEKMRYYYDGFSFDGKTKLYNPQRMALPLLHFCLFARRQREGYCRNAHQFGTPRLGGFTQRKNVGHRNKSSLRK